MPTVNCPTCNRPSEYAPSNRWRPFCSERCKLIDLGEWASEKNAIPCAEDSPHSEQVEPPATDA